MITMGSEFVWNHALVADLVVGIPAEAHQAAAIATAHLVASKAGRASGRLQADLASPSSLGPTFSQIGSDLPYAGIQEHGGTVTPKRSPRLLIHAGAGGTGPVVASASAVTIRGKHYLEEASGYLGLVVSGLAARMPHA